MVSLYQVISVYITWIMVTWCILCIYDPKSSAFRSLQCICPLPSHGAYALQTSSGLGSGRIYAEYTMLTMIYILHITQKHVHTYMDPHMKWKGYTHIHTYTCTYTCTCKLYTIHTEAHTDLCGHTKYAHRKIHTYTCVWTHTHTLVYTPTHTHHKPHPHTCTYTHNCTYM